MMPNRLDYPLAALTARYDRDVAAVVFAPVGDALLELAAGEHGLYVYGRDLVALMVVYDPQVVVDLISVLPDSARRVSKHLDGWINPGVEIPTRYRAAELLGLTPAERRREAVRIESFSQPSIRER